VTRIFEFQFTIKSGIGPTIPKKKKYQVSNKERDTESNNLNNSQNSPPFAAGVEKLK
jgi:hypothetical protein